MIENDAKSKYLKSCGSNAVRVQVPSECPTLQQGYHVITIQFTSASNDISFNWFKIYSTSSCKTGEGEEATEIAETEQQQLSEASSMSVYPNPSTDGILNISLQGIQKGEASSVKVFNALGAEVYSGMLQGNVEQIGLTEMPNGMYFIRVNNSSGVFESKIIINR